MLHLISTTPSLVLHSVEEPSDRELTTRWTLGFRFRMLPWAPRAEFSGVSKYTLDAEARVVSQNDFWDSINLQPGGDYAPAPKSAALTDLLGQLAFRDGAQQASDKELPYVLLRRAADQQGQPGCTAGHGREPDA